MDINMERKQESSFPHFHAENGKELYSGDHMMEIKNETVKSKSDYNLDRKTEIKDGSFLLTSSQNERVLCTKGLVSKSKSETVTCSSDCGIDEEAVDIDFCLLNEEALFSEDAVMKLLDYNEHYGMDSGIEFKGDWWFETSSRDVPCIFDEIKDVLAADLTSTESSKLHQGVVSSEKSALITNKNIGNNINFIVEDSAECKSPTKCKIQESECLKQVDSAKKSITTSCLEPNSLNLQKTSHQENSNENSTHKNVFINEYKCGTSEKNLTSSNCEKQLPHKCEICGKSFTRLSHLRIHKLIHEGRKPHQCEMCAKSFTQRSHLKEHKLIHEGKKPHMCEICGRSFTILSNLKTHKLIHGDKKPHMCETCGKCFTRLSDLKTHKLIHENRKPHICEVCGKCFTRLSDLKMHKFIHEGGKPHKCEFCGMGFAWSSTLKKHKLNDECRKPLVCGICGLSFTQSSSLEQHAFIHEGRKLYKCEICEKGFTRVSDLQVHKLIHGEKKLHKCDNCEKSFTRSSTLKKHKLIHANGKIHK